MFDASLVELGIDPCYGKLKALSKRLGFLCKNAEVLHLWAVRPEGAVVFWFMQTHPFEQGPRVKEKNYPLRFCFRIHENPRYANDDVFAPPNQVVNVKFPFNLFLLYLICIIFVASSESKPVLVNIITNRT